LAHPDGVLLPILEGQTILEMGRQLALQNDAFRDTVFEKDDLHFGTSILVILNGAIVNLHDRSETLLEDGDEVIFLSAVGGG
jgi:thiamine biosynthesis protein ThiS